MKWPNFDTLQYPLNENSSVQTEEISLIKPLRGPVRNWCQQPPLVLDLHGYTTPLARRLWTHLNEITGLLRKRSQHRKIDQTRSTAPLAFYHATPKNPQSLAQIMPDPPPICFPLYANWAAFSRYWAHTHTLTLHTEKLKNSLKIYLNYNSLVVFI